MNAKLKKKWVDALMSGAYEQAEGGLVSTDREGEVYGYCCLGVLAAASGAPITSIRAQTHLLECTGISALDRLNMEVKEELADMNDSGIPFEVIAGFVQEVL